MTRSCLALLLCAMPGLLGAGANGAAAPKFNGPHAAGEMMAPPRNEASGLAASRRSADLLWTHDDSGGETALFGINAKGELVQRLRIEGAKNNDWEDMAAVELDGKPWLVIGDIGDNDAKRNRVTLYFVEEPTAEALRQTDVKARPMAAVRITFSDGARDCEALAIDAKERAIYLLSKRDFVPRLYRATLPAAPLGDVDLKAEFLTSVRELARPTAADALLAGMFEKTRARPCGMDFAADGSAAVVVTYSDVVVFPRKAGETWAQAFSHAPVRLPPHSLPQAEAVCFSRDGASIFVASEETRKLLRYDRK